MADPPRYPDTGAGSDHESATGIPRWLKIVGIIVAVLVLLFVAVVLFGPAGPPAGGH
jgi:hypothetical protein